MSGTEALQHDQHSDSRQMTMRDVLQLRSLTGAVVLAGAEGLSREVTNAMVMEGPDVEKWGRPGLVLVTSLFALIPLSTQERERFFTTVHNIGIAGIIYKPGRTSAELLGSCLALAEQQLLPFVQMDPSFNFEDVLMDVMGTVIDSNARLLDTFYDVHHQTMHMALMQPSIYEVVEQLAQRVDADATYLNRREDVRIGTSRLKDSFQDLSLAEYPVDRHRSFHYFEATLSYPDGSAERALAVGIPSQSSSASYLVVHREPEEISAFRRIIIENYANLLVIELLKQDAIDQRLYNQNNMLVHDLLQGRLATVDEVDHAMSTLGIAEHQLYQVMLLRIALDDPSQTERLSDVLLAFRRRIKRLHPRVVFFESNDRLTFIRNHTSGSNGFEIPSIEDALADMHADQGLPGFTHLVALSEDVDRYSIATANEEVMGIYRLFDSNHLNNRLITYDNLGIYKFLIQTGDPARLASFIDPRIVLLHRENPEGYRTLVTLCECENNYREAAERLFVHSKTVRYRVGRIQEEYGIDVHSPDDLVQVLIAAKLVALLGPDWINGVWSDGSQGGVA